MTKVQKASWENADFLPSQQGSYTLARTGRVKHRQEVALCRMMALGVSLAFRARGLGAAQPRQTRIKTR